MKNVILLTILLIPFLTIAQESPAVKYFDKYSGNQGYTSAHITKHTFDFFTKINNNEEGKAFSENIAGVNTIKILIYDRPSKKTGENLFYNELLPSIHKSIYDEIMEVKEDEQNYKFFTKMENNKISEFLIVAYGPIENILVIIQGDINLNKLSKLSGTMNIEGFDHLGNIEKIN
jgi:hypothetical protein